MESTRSILLKGAIGVLAVSLSTIGMAYAGVDLPGTAAEEAIEAVTGLDLPNQADGQNQDPDKSRSDEVRAVHDGTLEGCEHGQAVAAAASANRKGDGGSDNDPCDKTDDSPTGSNGNPNAPAGDGGHAKGHENKPTDPGSAGGNGGGNANAPAGDGGNANGHENKPADPGSNGAGASTSSDAGDTLPTDNGRGNDDKIPNPHKPTDPGKDVGETVSGAAHGKSPNK